MSRVIKHLHPSGSAPALVRRCGLAAGCATAAALAVLTAGGCANVDSYLDPSGLGRWEYTPTNVPVLDHISSIEGKPEDLVEYSPILASDLIPDPLDVRVGPSDELIIKIFDIVRPGEAPEEFRRVVDTRGLIDIPQLGRIYVNGKNIPQIREAIVERAKVLVGDPLVDIDIVGQRSQTFTIIGAVDQPGPYRIPKPDFKVMEALTSGGRMDTTIDEIYVIRSIPLSGVVTDPINKNPPREGLTGADQTNPAANPSKRPDDDPLKAIDELTNPRNGTPKNPSPGMVKTGNRTSPAPGSSRQPETKPGQPREPAIDLPSADSPNQPKPSDQNAPGSAPWVFSNGKWIQVRPSGPNIGPQGPEPVPLIGETDPSQLLSQRVIKIPMKRLMAGDATVNIIIHPEDVIHIPQTIRSEFYISGFVRRPGVFNLPDRGKMTILRAIATAGGLDSLAIPERAELTRVVGNGREATVSVNIRAIAEKTQPDIFLKADDHLNIGTNFWALPLAVLRNGLRTNYGFGFLLDRNFGTDVFGVPPEYQNRQRNPINF